MHRSSLLLGLLTLACALAVALPGEAAATGPTASAGEAEGLEAQTAGRIVHPTSRPDVDVLMIPDSGADVVGMYDPFDGTYLGDLITENPGFATPVNAIVGPDGNIYVSEQLNDKVFVFDTDGNYLFTYADESDGLNNIRGIAFRGEELFITSGDDYVARFNGPHSRLPDFINDGSDPYDIYFLEDGTALLADIQGTADNVRYYDAEGTFQYELFPVNFPEQVQGDPELPGAYLNASFSADIITDFELDGTIVNTWSFNGGRGIYRLGNGNLLATAGDGVWEIDPATGGLLEQENTGSARFIELLPATTSSVEPGAQRTRLAFVGSPSLATGDMTIRFELPRTSQVEVGVFEPSGRCLKLMRPGVREAGRHELRWSGAGAGVASGVYFIRLQAGPDQAVRRVVVSR